MKRYSIEGLGSFALLSLGQMLSQIGSIMVSLGLMFWAYEITGRATELAMLGFFTLLPPVLFGPLAGAVIDRCRRKTLLIACDLLAGLGAVIVLCLLSAGSLRIWHLYALSFASALFGTVQGPAFLASATMMVPKRHYARASGLMSLSGNVSAVVSPGLGGVLFAVIGLRGLLLIDFATMLFAVVSLLLVRIPEPDRSDVSAQGNGLAGLLDSVRAGLAFLLRRRELLRVLVLFAVGNVFASVYETLYRALILARTDGSEIAMAMTQSMIGIGGIAAAVLVSLFGSPRRKMYGMLTAFALGGLCRAVFGANVGLPVLATCALLSTLFFTYAGSCSNAFWQSKVPPALQGRVLATRFALAKVLALGTRAISGPLADHVFEPAMYSGGPLVASMGWLAGSGPGAGIGLFICLTSAATVVLLVFGFCRRSIRDVDARVPDHDAQSPSGGSEDDASRPGVKKGGRG